MAGGIARRLDAGVVGRFGAASQSFGSSSRPAFLHVLLDGARQRAGGWRNGHRDHFFLLQLRFADARRSEVCFRLRSPARSGPRSSSLVVGSSLSRFCPFPGFNARGVTFNFELLIGEL